MSPIICCLEKTIASAHLCKCESCGCHGVKLCRGVPYVTAMGLFILAHLKILNSPWIQDPLCVALRDYVPSPKNSLSSSIEWEIRAVSSYFYPRPFVRYSVFTTIGNNHDVTGNIFRLWERIGCVLSTMWEQKYLSKESNENATVTEKIV
eukprot:PhF_6_TR22745/c0_g1_i2/m.32423